ANLALLFGAEFDAEIERGRQLQGGIPAEEDIQLPPRDTRQIRKHAKKEKELVAEGRRLRSQNEPEVASTRARRSRKKQR
ncbi:MAG: YihY/virulence factor BrkB family protein, partial [Candidatus Microbacterium stercoravium]